MNNARNRRCYTRLELFTIGHLLRSSPTRQHITAMVNELEQLTMVYSTVRSSVLVVNVRLYLGTNFFVDTFLNLKTYPSTFTEREAKIVPIALCR
jgi:hypothetical protein